MKKQTRGSTRSKLDTADAAVELARHDPRMRFTGGFHETHLCSVRSGGDVCGRAGCAERTTTKTKTKIEVKDGKDITVSGCLERNPGGGYMLTTTQGAMKYALVTDDDLSKHVGHRVEVKGKAADRGDGKVKIESTVGSGDDKAKAKTEIKGDMSGMHYLGVKSLKMISTSCM